MSLVLPEIEFVDRSLESIRYLEHGWPTDLCRWHAHEELELHLITRTHGKALVGDYVGEFRPGDLYLIGPNLPHNWVTDNAFESPVERRDMLVQFHRNSIEAIDSAFPEFRQVNDLLALGTAGIRFTGFPLQDAVNRMEDIRDAAGASRILAFLTFLELLARHDAREQLSVVTFSRPQRHPQHARIGEVVDHIARNYASDLSVSGAAEMAGMSEASFSRTFRSLTGNRYPEFVNRVRIGQACALLYATDERISSICYNVGFQNLGNFNRQFLRMKRTTPSAFREAARRTLATDPARNDASARAGALQ